MESPSLPSVSLSALFPRSLGRSSHRFSDPPSPSTGTRLAFLRLPPSYAWLPYFGAVLYAAVTPFGMIIGLAVRSRLVRLPSPSFSLPEPESRS